MTKTMSLDEKVEKAVVKVINAALETDNDLRTALRYIIADAASWGADNCES